MPKAQNYLSSSTDIQIIEKLIQSSTNLSTSKLWKNGEIQVPVLQLTPDLIQAISFARRCGQLKGGLEQIEVILKKLYLTLANSDKKEQYLPSGRTVSPKQPSILFVSNDGQERFYRACERILLTYPTKVFGFYINADAVTIGKTFFGDTAFVKAMLLNKKNCIEKVLETFVNLPKE